MVVKARRINDRVMAIGLALEDAMRLISGCAPQRSWRLDKKIDFID